MRPRSPAAAGRADGCEVTVGAGGGGALVADATASDATGAVVSAGGGGVVGAAGVAGVCAALEACARVRTKIAAANTHAAAIHVTIVTMSSPRARRLAF